MPQEPTDPETLDEYLDDEQDEQGAVFEGDDPRAGRELGETSEGDAVEQRLELLRSRDTPLTGREPDTANPADAAEQSRVVDPGDDEYR